MPPFLRLGTAVALVATAVTYYGAAPAQAAPPDRPAAAAGTRITLITGDVVDYRESDGTVRVEPATRADGTSPTFTTMSTSDGVFVYPSDAVGLVTSHKLDPELFNVRTLLHDGRQDTATGAIPVIARPDGRPTSLVPSVRLAHALAVKVDKTRAPQFWRSLTTDTLGVAEVSLDRKVEVALDRSTRQVGAPAAWDLGFDGTGTRVAVVDTGIDETHPDLEGRVAAKADFSPDGDGEDHYGHGTHVASILAGTGKASDGRYRGMAPGATLVSAKVFDGTGTGDMSQVMAGVEWAVAQKVKVVNMSLGAGITDGTDPLSELVDRLSAETGTLFVVAAGNYGSADRAISTPGAAASALTVGAVDREDKLAWFSSRGPRLRDALVKPEIVAPGVGIVAARAAGTSMGDPVDDSYTAAEGTSMATPHVAGAALLLAQQHPDWTGQTIKNALVSTAADVGAKWYEQGAGRLDVARAVRQSATGLASASFGKVDGGDSTSRTMTFTNNGSTAKTLALDLGVQSWDGKPMPKNEMVLGAKAVAVAPRSTVPVTVTVNPEVGPDGVYGGTVVATTSDGESVRTPVSTYNAPDLFPVSVRVLDSAGRPAQQTVVQLIDDALGTSRPNDPFLADLTYAVDLVDGEGSVQLPFGTYSALGSVTERGVAVRRWTGLSAPEVRVDKATTITLDARSAVPVEIGTTVPTDQRDRTVALRRVLPAMAGRDGYITEVGTSAGPSGTEVRVTPSAPAKVGAISLQDHATLGTAAVDMVVAGQRYTPTYDVPTVTSTWPGGHEVPVVAPGAADAKGKAVLAKIAVPPNAPDPVAAVNQATSAAAQAAAKAGAAALVTYVDAPGALPVALTAPPLPVFALGNAEGERLRAATGPLTITVRPAPDAMFNLDVLDRNGVPKQHSRTLRPDQLVATRTTYHADQPGVTAQKTYYAFPNGLWKTQFNQAVRIPVPGSWTEYTGPGDPGVVWKRVVTEMANRAALSMNQLNTYQPTERTRPDEHWFAAPLRATAAQLGPDHPARYPAAEGRWRVLCSNCREGDLFTPALQWTDGTGYVGPYENAKYFTTTTARLFRGTEEIKPLPEDMALFPRFPLLPQSAVYRLDVTDALAGPGQNGAPSTPLLAHATRTDTSWTFTSAPSTVEPPSGYSCLHGTKCAFQPLIQLDYRLGLSPDNTLTARTFDVAAAQPLGARNAGSVAWVRVATSTDGKTWQDAQVKPSGGGVWTVTAPRTTGDVWLRTEARDSLGNTVVQTVQKAYRAG
ncbi:S8 family peptidase [Actinokineospora auranticolor]|uniref:Subtilase family protein n=1 Tax=Actinokineospora auranticolor TaxID=155976 RepID=A0A2S6GZB7_9PSEU|nr:S8 family peptidase [Actinokineospora auranticolor]PPK70579.1 subtilase family protein [Actinokineospora auranticolor]